MNLLYIIFHRKFWYQSLLCRIAWSLTLYRRCERRRSNVFVWKPARFLMNNMKFLYVLKVFICLNYPLPTNEIEHHAYHSITYEYILHVQLLYQYHEHIINSVTAVEKIFLKCRKFNLHFHYICNMYNIISVMFDLTKFFKIMC